MALARSPSVSTPTGPSSTLPPAFAAEVVHQEQLALREQRELLVPTVLLEKQEQRALQGQRVRPVRVVLREQSVPRGPSGLLGLAVRLARPDLRGPLAQ